LKSLPILFNVITDETLIPKNLHLLDRQQEVTGGQWVLHRASIDG